MQQKNDLPQNYNMEISCYKILSFTNYCCNNEWVNRRVHWVEFNWQLSWWIWVIISVLCQETMSKHLLVPASKMWEFSAFCHLWSVLHCWLDKKTNLKTLYGLCIILLSVCLQYFRTFYRLNDQSILNIIFNCSTRSWSWKGYFSRF